ILSSYAGDKPGDKLTEVFKKDVKPRVSLIPAGVKIAKDFKPGKGEAIGTVKAIKGTVLTIHRDEKTAYILKKGNKLYTSDTLISEEQSKAQAELNDGSFITLGPYTKIVFDKSVYDPSKPTRNSLLSLLFGKARFIVTKLANFRDSRFKVKTPTAVAGVRGSDFAICVAPGSPLTTTIMTGEGTTVTFAGNTGPTQLVGPMSASSATQGMAAASALPISNYLNTPFFLSGASKVPYYYYIAGGVAVGGAVVLSKDSDSDDDDPPIVTSVSPPEGTVIPGATTISFYFSKNMTQAGITTSNFVIVPGGDWTVVTLNWPNGQNVDVDISPTTVPTGFTITLVGFTDTGGKPLVGQTSFVYN
ncbi:MAG: FecR domain-containing protein, partial [Thermodesulfobacteriota bacterium]|nr:FecR domain-containing protein [Thermodesulfobacteriota bacterium]